MKVRNGHTVKVHYKGTLSDGTEFDNSHVRGEPLNFEVGSRKLIRGFSEAVLGMSKGQTKKVTVPIEAAYGPHNPEAIQAVPRKAFAEGMEFENWRNSTRKRSTRPILGKDPRGCRREYYSRYESSPRRQRA